MPKMTAYTKAGADARITEQVAIAVAGIDFNTTGLVSEADTRLEDARTPTAHKSSHVKGGSDPLAITELAAGTTDPNKRLVPNVDGSLSWETNPDTTLRAASKAALPTTGLSVGTFGLDTSKNITYRWNGVRWVVWAGDVSSLADPYRDPWFTNRWDYFESRLSARDGMITAVLAVRRNSIPFYFGNWSVELVLPLDPSIRPRRQSLAPCAMPDGLSTDKSFAVMSPAYGHISLWLYSAFSMVTGSEFSTTISWAIDNL